MNKQPSPTLPVCLFHTNVLGKRAGATPARGKSADRCKSPNTPGSALGSKLCSASSHGQDVANEALKPLQRGGGWSEWPPTH